MINQFSKEFAQFFEKLRHSRNLTQEQFTTGIVSMRQYRRYIRGECLIPQYVVNDLSIRLGFNPDRIIAEFDAERNKEAQLIGAFYNAAANRDIPTLKKHLKNIDKNRFLDDQNRLLFQHTMNYYHLITNKINNHDMIQATFDLINYSELIKKQVFTTVELLILTSLFVHDNYYEKSLLAEKLNGFLNKLDPYVLAQKDNMNLLVIYRLIRYYGSNKEYKKVIALTDRAIESCLSNKNYYLLEYFYYYAAGAHKLIGNDTETNASIFKCFCILYADNNKAKIKKFTGYIEKEFKINFKQFAANYIKQL